MGNKMKFIILVAALGAGLVGCTKSNSVSNLASIDGGGGGGGGGGGTSTTNTCSAPKTSVLFMGERASSATAAIRGAFSDLKIIPGTTYPASAYVDTGCTCVKYTYWDGTDWNTEVISGANSTSFNYLRLGFLSTGVPVVVWGNATTTLQIAIRNTTSGAWTVSNLDTAGTAIQPIELSINPLDQVAILYARNTAGAATLILCSANCNNAANYSAPSASLGTVGATPRTMGVGWCKASASVYYPVVAVTGAANSAVGVCRQSTLANCVTGATPVATYWAGGALQTLTTSGINPTVQLGMDSSTIDAEIQAVVSKPATGLVPYVSAWGGCATGTPAAIAGGATVTGTTATSGTAFIEIARDNSGAYHMAANDGVGGILSVKYYNTVGATFATFNPGGNIAVATTALLAAAGAGRGGFAVDSTLGQAYSTFARTATTAPAAFLGNLAFGWVENSTLASSATSVAYDTPLTNDGQMQTLTNQVPNLAVAATSSGIPAAAFVDYSQNAATAGVLRYAYRTGTTATSNWAVRTVPIASQPQNIALTFDSSNLPWIAFYDQASFRFYVASNTQTDGSGVWSTYHFPFPTAVTAATAPAYHSVAIAMDRSAAVITPVVIVGIANHATPSNTGVWSSKLNSRTGVWSTPVQVVSTNAANSISNVTADYDATGNIVAAYYNRGSNRVEYAHSVNGGTAYSTPAILVSSMGMGLKIKMNPVTSRPAVSFFDRANNRVYYGACSTALASCSTPANWNFPTVDSSAGVNGIATASDGLLGTGLTFTAAGEAYVTYPVGSINNGSLSINNNVSGSFGTTSVLAAGRNADQTSITTISPINFAQSGWNVDSVRTSSGSLHSVYVGPANWLYVSSCGD